MVDSRGNRDVRGKILYKIRELSRKCVELILVD